MPDTARFSAVIPLYNGGRTLAGTLEAILRQTHSPIEIIVIDDGSTDDGPAVAARYPDKITLLRTERNSGVQMARNRGIEHANGNWIALCDQDDLWSPDYLARNAALLSAAPQLDFVFTNFRRCVDGVMEAQTKFDQAPAEYWQQARRRTLPEGWVFEHGLAGQSFVWHPIFPSATIIARRLYEAVGGFNPALRGLRPEDGEFTLRCLYRAAAGAIPDPLVTIQRHDTNFSRDQLLTLVDEVAVLQFVRANHPEARPLWPVIDAEIRRRRVMAAHAAFARGEHALLRQLRSDIAPADLDLRLRMKAAVAALPAPLDAWVNTALQRLRAAWGNVG